MKIIRICLENIISSSVIVRSRLSYLWNTSTSFHFSCFIEHFFSCLLLSSLSAALPPCWQRLCWVCVIWTQALQIKHAVLSSQEATHITFIFFGFFSVCCTTVFVHTVSLFYCVYFIFIFSPACFVVCQISSSRPRDPELFHEKVAQNSINLQTHRQFYKIYK